MAVRGTPWPTQRGRDLGLRVAAERLGISPAYLSRIEISKSIWHRVPFAKRSYLELVRDSGERIFGVHLAAIHSNVTEVVGRKRHVHAHLFANN